MRLQTLALVLTIAAAPSMALAGPVPAEAGSPGRAADARRTIDVVMRDNTFEPQAIQVRPGETIRFRVVNRGQLLHEFNIGTPAMHEVHRREMLAMMQAGHMTATSVMAGHGGHGAMAHDDPNSVLLEPGKRGEVIWRFPQGGTLEI
ncbi:MAG: cupredoxin domain-containing protein, partial [Acetobacteraceae bacterium]|nr:cupredoxin domain-containing protein [Acetobacteraceae bacterium]